MPETAISLLARFTIRRGKEAQALQLIGAVKRQSARDQPGTLVYLVHRVLDKQYRPTRTLLFYERYRDQAALNAHVDASSWQALLRDWKKCFEGAKAKVMHVAAIAEFVRPGAVSILKSPPARRKQRPSLVHRGRRETTQARSRMTART